jgi:hypothetical protein
MHPNQLPIQPIILCSDSTFSASYTYSTPKTWDTPPPSPTIISKFPDIIPPHLFDILLYLALEPFSLSSLIWP